jgi:hypothetical protein
MRGREAPANHNGAAGDEEERGDDRAGSDSSIGPVEAFRRRSVPSDGRVDQPTPICAIESFAQVPRHRLGVQPGSVVT